MQFPDWYEGGSEDAENLVIDFLKPMLNAITPNVSVYSWLPDFSKIEHFPVLSIYRLKGASDPSKGVDYPIIHTVSLSQKRADSTALDDFVRMMLFTAKDGMRVKKRDGTYGQIVSVDSADGPDMIPGPDWASRVIVSAYQLETRNVSNSLSDYEGIVRGLHR